MAASLAAPSPETAPPPRAPAQPPLVLPQSTPVLLLLVLHLPNHSRAGSFFHGQAAGAGARDSLASRSIHRRLLTPKAGSTTTEGGQARGAHKVCQKRLLRTAPPRPNSRLLWGWGEVSPHQADTERTPPPSIYTRARAHTHIVLPLPFSTGWCAQQGVGDTRKAACPWRARRGLPLLLLLLPPASLPPPHPPRSLSSSSSSPPSFFFSSLQAGGEGGCPEAAERRGGGGGGGLCIAASLSSPLSAKPHTAGAASRLLQRGQEDEAEEEAVVAARRAAQKGRRRALLLLLQSRYHAPFWLPPSHILAALAGEGGGLGARARGGQNQSRAREGGTRQARRGHAPLPPHYTPPPPPLTDVSTQPSPPTHPSSSPPHHGEGFAAGNLRARASSSPAGMAGLWPPPGLFRPRRDHHLFRSLLGFFLPLAPGRQPAGLGAGFACLPSIQAAFPPAGKASPACNAGEVRSLPYGGDAERGGWVGEARDGPHFCESYARPARQTERRGGGCTAPLPRRVEERRSHLIPGGQAGISPPLALRLTHACFI